MKRKTMAIIVCLLLFMTVARIDAGKPKTIEIYPDESIQAGIDEARPGYTVLVHSGTYYENLTIDKKVKLVGENVTIDGWGESVVNITSNNVVFSGFTVLDGNKGIQIWYSNGCSILNNNISNSNLDNIHLESSNHNKIEGNQLSEGYVGIRLNNSHHNNILNNNASNMIYSGQGIILESSNSNIIKDNIITNNYIGIFVYSSFKNTLLNNFFSGNTINLRYD